VKAPHLWLLKNFIKISRFAISRVAMADGIQKGVHSFPHVFGNRAYCLHFDICFAQPTRAANHMLKQFYWPGHRFLGFRNPIQLHFYIESIHSTAIPRSCGTKVYPLISLPRPGGIAYEIKANYYFTTVICCRSVRILICCVFILSYGSKILYNKSRLQVTTPPNRRLGLLIRHLRILLDNSG